MFDGISQYKSVFCVDTLYITLVELAEIRKITFSLY